MSPCLALPGRNSHARTRTVKGGALQPLVTQSCPPSLVLWPSSVLPTHFAGSRMGPQVRRIAHARSLKKGCLRGLTPPMSRGCSLQEAGTSQTNSVTCVGFPNHGEPALCSGRCFRAFRWSGPTPGCPLTIRSQKMNADLRLEDPKNPAQCAHDHLISAFERRSLRPSCKASGSMSARPSRHTAHRVADYCAVVLV